MVSEEGIGRSGWETGHSFYQSFKIGGNDGRICKLDV